ncbi:NADH:ubiquinone oxidoreductase [Kickxella alabastrina]|uniref:NADH:ubiquinone oxidoreductase n=1 Tax=Kickxella alabastrina TaxID=61397 RepID=A0ACC1IUF0_9FUNG|nr:NADH:ubiquinone oxidoreductase [Kickxella alabastrina]
MDAQERRAFIERAPQVEYKGIPLDYELQENPRTDVLEAEANKDEDEDEGEDENEPAFVVKFAVPDNVAMPKTQRLFGIIEQTARFIVEQPSAMANRMELVIQGKQGTNPDFAFLSARSPLYAFYKHLQWLMQTGLYGYNAESSSSSDSEQEKDQEQEQEQHPFAVPSPAPLIQPEPEPEPEPLPSVPSTVSVPTDAPTRQLIDTVALLMCKSPNPQKLEQTMRVEKATTSTYRFLSPFDPLHASFASAEDEIEYWRSEALNARQALEEKQYELDDYQLQSAELETELEQEIERMEATINELRSRNEKYRMDMAELKEKYQHSQLKAGEDLASIERELQFVRSQQEYYKSRTRDLEQTNDDLERNERAAKSSLQAMECRLSRAVEENSHLMGEVNTKKILVDEVQRLKDELKDLNLELNVVRSRSSRAVPQSGSSLSKSTANADFNGENPALMVHNIMTRVKDLESRLAGARTKVTPLIGAGGQYATMHSRIARTRNIANPKSAVALASNGGSNGAGAGDHQQQQQQQQLQRPTALRSIAGAKGETRISNTPSMESKLEQSRLQREAIRKRIEEKSMAHQQQQQQTVPQRRQLD